MKHLLSYAVLVTCSLVTSSALAESPACGSADSLSRQFLYGMANVPRDARLPFWWADCGEGPLSTELQDDDGTPIPTTAPVSGRSIRTVQPVSPLAANRQHRIVVRQRGEEVGKIFFM